MLEANAGSFRLFRLFGIDVWLHWSWFIVAYLQFQLGGDRFNNSLWHVATYLSLFGIVLLHEFGHSLACKSVGGHADRIILWPLGGVAFVRPPPRPGAVLWSIAAGPLVNLLLAPVTLSLLLLVLSLNLDNDPRTWSDIERYAVAVTSINIMLFIFNMLPIYPLDGGQIAREVLVQQNPGKGIIQSLWLSVFTAACLAVFALSRESIFMTLMFGYLAYSSYATIQAYTGRGGGQGW